MVVFQMGYEINDKRGDRIRTERLRLGLSQKDFAALFGKKTMAVLRYEKGERVMSHEDLELLYEAGVDVWFLLTGERTKIDLLSEEAKELLKLWDSVEASQRKILMILVRNFAESFIRK